VTGPAEQRAQHRLAVESDYNRRVGQWVTIYEGTTFHDWAIRVRLERTAAILDALGVAGPALDVGCGGGQLLALMAQRGLEAFGTDLAGGMVTASNERLAHEGLEADVRQAVADDLPFDDATFGVITALGLVEYVDEPMRALREMARVLAPGGHLIVTAPNPARLAYLLDPVGTVMGRFRSPPAGYRRHYWTPRGFRRVLVDAGLDVHRLEGHGLGPLMFAGRQVVSDPRSIAVSIRLERSLPAPWSAWLGANLIAVAGKQ
jgi:2-polyprenyl-3-methyl-5-hydroxy-6-metoxy-1,4-benzoquinol methylase